MLILTRKPGESLYIGDNIKVTIVEIKGNQIRVGIEAPTDLRIYREEIYLQILDENKTAAQGVMTDASLDQLSGGWKGVPKSGGVPSGGGSKRVSLRQQGTPQRVGSKASSQSSGKDVTGTASPVVGGEKES
jgi:carbon storage regulator